MGKIEMYVRRDLRNLSESQKDLAQKFGDSLSKCFIKKTEQYTQSDEKWICEHRSEERDFVITYECGGETQMAIVEYRTSTDLVRGFFYAIHQVERFHNGDLDISDSSHQIVYWSEYTEPDYGATRALNTPKIERLLDEIEELLSDERLIP